MLAMITVNTTVDENDGIGVGGISLRDAIAAAMPGDTIDFSVTGTILLTDGQLTIDKSLSIVGPGSDLLSIDASGNDPTPTENNGDGRSVFHVLSSANPVSIAGLTITGGDSLTGGGIGVSGNLSISGCAIVGNNASTNGGGINVVGNSVVLNIADSIISGNTARNGGGMEAIVGIFSEITILKSTIAYNEVIPNSLGQGGYAGGMKVSGGSLTISASTISNNMSPKTGGGILREVAGTESTLIENTTISGNRAAQAGGGLRVYNTTAPNAVLLRNVTITENESPAGAGLSLQVSNTVESHLSVISQNVMLNGSTPSNISGTLSSASSFNLVGSNGNGGLNPLSNIIDVDDPLLGPLTNNGGPTLTHLPQAGSPLVGAGDPDFSPPPNEDQRGFDREVNIIDVGAVEVGPEDPECNIPGDYSRNGVVDAADYSIWRDHLDAESPFYALPNEGASPGVVDIEDYNFWKAHFGDSCEEMSPGYAANSANAESATSSVDVLPVTRCSSLRINSVLFVVAVRTPQQPTALLSFAADLRPISAFQSPEMSPRSNKFLPLGKSHDASNAIASSSLLATLTSYEYPSNDAGTKIVDTYYAIFDTADQRGASRVIGRDCRGGERIDIRAIELALGEAYG